eukprot:COSAG06_NODE_189_length_20763_cov_8.677376_15_plen_36_part_00
MSRELFCVSACDGSVPRAITNERSGTMHTQTNVFK